MKDYGKWKKAEMGYAIVPDKPVHERVNDKENVNAYGGYLVAESIFNEDIRELIIKSPEMVKMLKKCRDFLKLKSYGTKLIAQINDLLNEIEGDND